MIGGSGGTVGVTGISTTMRSWRGVVIVVGSAFVRFLFSSELGGVVNVGVVDTSEGVSLTEVIVFVGFGVLVGRTVLVGTRRSLLSPVLSTLGGG